MFIKCWLSPETAFAYDGVLRALERPESPPRVTITLLVHHSNRILHLVADRPIFRPLCVLKMALRQFAFWSGVRRNMRDANACRHGERPFPALQLLASPSSRPSCERSGGYVMALFRPNSCRGGLGNSPTGAPFFCHTTVLSHEYFSPFSGRISRLYATGPVRTVQSPGHPADRA